LDPVNFRLYLLKFPILDDGKVAACKMALSDWRNLSAWKSLDQSKNELQPRIGEGPPN